MSFNNVLEHFENFDFEKYLNSVSDNDILNSLNKTKLNNYDLLNLLSDNAIKYLEPIARKANKLTHQYFGKAILLYAPIYISNYCQNVCLYCGFNSRNKINRAKLSLHEIEVEAVALKSTGIEHVLLLTGEDCKRSGFEYIKKAVQILKKHFHSVSIEIYPMETDEYSELKTEGVDGLTIYQEVYDKEIYKKVHLGGKKRNYQFRLDTPERGAAAGIRTVNIGALFGLGNIASEAFFTALHAKYLSDKYLNTEFGVSFPRINTEGTNFSIINNVEDKKFIQMIIAMRLFLPKVGITVSTRESSSLRDKIIHLGATKLSAGSSTTVGGYTEINNSDQQFDITDTRSVDEVSEMLKKNNFQPIFKDWEQI
ncbi:MAG: 2-iminoacetate synthase ThiH [bacterium]|nr:2-iminoacetate synthase ThiH [bacterium]